MCLKQRGYLTVLIHGAILTRNPYHNFERRVHLPTYYSVLSSIYIQNSLDVVLFSVINFPNYGIVIPKLFYLL